MVDQFRPVLRSPESLKHLISLGFELNNDHVHLLNELNFNSSACSWAKPALEILKTTIKTDASIKKNKNKNKNKNGNAKK